MNLIPDSSTRNIFLIALVPCLVVSVLIFFQFFTAYGFNTTETDEFLRTNFSFGLLMSLGSGYLWLCLKFNNLNVISALISLLIKTNRLSEFSFKRKQLRSRYKLDAFNALVVACILVTFLVFVENLLSAPPTLHQYAYLMNTVVFFFFLGLAIVQISSNLNYLKKDVLVNVSNETDHINGLFVIVKLSMSYISKLIYLALVIPLLYIHREMMVSELLIFFIFFILVICGPIKKTWKLYCYWYEQKLRNSDKFDESGYSSRIFSGSVSADTIDTNSESSSAKGLLEVKKYIASLSLILLFWLAVHIFNS